MALSKKPYRGTRDLFPKNKRKLNFLMEAMHKSASLFGYENYDGPLLEEVDLYLAKSGEELINDQIYSFIDRGERNVAIRPEMTPTLARMMAQIINEAPKPIRWYSIPNLMRYEKPQKGRLREHWQFNCDIFGQDGKYGELEILQLACHLMTSFGATAEQFEIRLNDRAIIDYIFLEKLELDKDQAYKLYKLVDRAQKIKPEVFEKDLAEIITDTKKQSLFKSYLDVKNFDDLKKLIDSMGSSEVTNEFFGLVEMINSDKIKDFIVYDPSIVRGLDYYTGVVFEIFDKHPDNRRAICGGGSYSELLKIFNEKPVNATGFGLGDVTLLDFLETHGLMPNLDKNEVDVYLSVQTDAAESLINQLASSLRAEGISVVANFQSIKLKKSLKDADKFGCQFATLIGDQELDKKTIVIKDLKNRDQIEFPIDNHTEIFKYIKRD